MSGSRYRSGLVTRSPASEYRVRPRALSMQTEARDETEPGPPVQSAHRPRARGFPPAKFVWILYADRVHLNGDPERRARMFDFLYLATGLGFFALMGAYARWAGRA